MRRNSEKAETLTVIVLTLLSYASIVVESVTPPPSNRWGVAGMILFLTSLLFFRAAKAVTSTSAFALLPYILATFAALGSMIVLAPVYYANLAVVIYLFLVGIAMLSWIVSVVIASFKKTFHR